MHISQMRVRLALLIAVMVVAATGHAHAADRFVSTAGSDTANDCQSSISPCATIGRALTQAASGDTVNVAGGRYEEPLRIVTPIALTFLGGWDGAFTGRNPRGNPGVVRAIGPEGRRDRAWFIRGGDISVTIDGFTLADGDGDNGDYCCGGGGLLVIVDGGPITLAVRDTTITGNQATDDLGNSGGGVALRALGAGGSLNAAFTDVTFSRNRSNNGGGLYVDGPDTTVSLTNAVFTRNRAAREGFLFTPGAAMNVALGATANLVNVTMVKNRGRVSVAHVTHATMNLTNTIVWQKRGMVPTDLFVEGATGVPSVANVDHSDVGMVTTSGGTFNDLGGNLSVDPRVRSDGTLRGGLAPVIDVGTCTGAPTTDFEGDARPSGAGCDMGADEFVP
jgi:predicted outer membrane repeat protein